MPAVAEAGRERRRSFRLRTPDAEDTSSVRIALEGSDESWTANQLAGCERRASPDPLSEHARHERQQPEWEPVRIGPVAEGKEVLPELDRDLLTRLV